MEITPVQPISPLATTTHKNETRFTKTYIDSDGEKRVRDTYFTVITYSMNGKEQSFTNSRVVDMLV